MARIFKAKYPKMSLVKDAGGNTITVERTATKGRNKGQKVKVPKREPVLGRNGKPIYIEARGWTIEYTDAQGRTRRVAGFTDKRATQQRLAEIERQVERQRAGIVDVSFDHAKAPIKEHIDAWLADLARVNRSPDYIRKVRSRINRLRKELGWTALGSLQPDPLSRWLGFEICGGLGERTANHYLETAIAFCNWCVAQRRLERNQIECVSKATVVEPRCVRRAATLEELGRLLQTSGKRALVYLTAVLTGLRRKELQLLQWGDVILDDAQPRLALRAQTTKSRRADTIPIPPELAEALRENRPADWRSTNRVFSSIPKSSTVRRDFEQAGIPYEVDGRKLDLHALRTTFGTLLATSKVDIREAMELMRHRDIRLTTRVYTDLRLIDTHGAAAKLPRISGKDGEADRMRATGTDGAVAPTKAPDQANLRMAPCMADSCSPQGISQSSPDIPSQKARAEKSPEKPAGDLSGHFPASCDSDKSLSQNMEAGGIEPPSRDGSRRASTCVVGRLNLGAAGAGRQAPAFPSLTVGSPAHGRASCVG